MDAENPRAVIGDNQPPETPFEQSKREIDDLWLEATNWLDGEPISTAEQAAEIEKLSAMIQAAIKRAEANRKVEKDPLDEAVKEIQDRYNTLIGDNKSVTGIAVKARAACLQALAPWRKKQADEKAAAAAAARAEADRKAEEARAAFAASNVDNLAERHEAEQKLAEAQQAEKVANREERNVSVGNRLRTVRRAEIVDMKAFAAWFWGAHRSALEEFFKAEAARLLRANVGLTREIHGVVIHTDEVPF